MKKPRLIHLVTLGIITLLILLFLVLNFLILKNTTEYHQHNVFGDTDNIVFLSPDGHKELVVDREGNPVLTGPNSASYNFCHPIENPVCHYFRDTKPWIRWGNSPDDPTTVKQRRQAFLRDYVDGIKRTFWMAD